MRELLPLVAITSSHDSDIAQSAQVSIEAQEGSEYSLNPSAGGT
jgi:D-arabinose 5-phosphate isomerase GutQ